MSNTASDDEEGVHKITLRNASDGGGVGRGVKSIRKASYDF